MDRIDRKNFVHEIASVVNKYSLENDSNTPDIIIGEYLYQCLEAYNNTIKLRNDWYYRADRVKVGVIDPMQPNSHEKAGSKSV